MKVAENHCKAIVSEFQNLGDVEQRSFVNVLSSLHGFDSMQSKMDPTCIDNLSNLSKIRSSFNPAYRETFVRLARFPYGISFLTQLRSVVKDELARTQSDSLQFLNNELFDLLRIWFSAGLIQLNRITWDSPCSMLETISKHEAVHPVRSWLDLRERVGPYRRVFTYTHPSMPEEPLVILYTALMREVSSSMASLLTRPRQVTALEEAEDARDVRAAVFYSISAPNRGLGGIDLGQSLIKRVVEELRHEFPDLSVFSSLSPVPGFAKWLTQNSSDPSFLAEQWRTCGRTGKVIPSDSVMRELLKFLAANFDSPARALKLTLEDSILQFGETELPVEPLMHSICAFYLAGQRSRVNPVANFHLRNGAQLWRLNWRADLTSRGLAQSFGMMVNYRYFLQHTTDLGHRYSSNSVVSVSPTVGRQLAPYQPDNLYAIEHLT